MATLSELVAEANERYGGKRMFVGTIVDREKEAYVNAKTINADWETIVAAMKTEAQEHHIEENLNLGQYRTKYACSCGEEWVTDGHDTAHPQWSFGDHCRRAEARAAFEAAGFYVEES